MNEAAFFELFHPGLPRLGPGSRQDTARALSLISGLPAVPDVLDVGCGNGGQTLILASLLPSARITAVDQLPIMLAELGRRAAQSGFTERVMAVQGDMTALGFESESFDLIWSEGAAYNMGFSAALTSWRRLLKPGGVLALSDIAWFKPDPPAELREFWMAECPGMTVEAVQLTQIKDNGYSLIGHFPLPAESWWSDYYDHIAREIPQFRQRHQSQPDWLAVADAVEMEMDMHRKYSDFFGYIFYVCRRSA